MVEMLGVLAIIGVLSVGGLMGYYKAMERYRVNETVARISRFISEVIMMFPDGVLPECSKMSLLKLGLVSEKELTEEKERVNCIVNINFPVGTDIGSTFISAASRNSYYHNGRWHSQKSGYVEIEIYDMTPSECIGLMTANWSQLSQAGLFVVNWKGKPMPHLLPTVAEATEACSPGGWWYQEGWGAGIEMFFFWGNPAAVEAERRSWLGLD